MFLLNREVCFNKCLLRKGVGPHKNTRQFFLQLAMQQMTEHCIANCRIHVTCYHVISQCCKKWKPSLLFLQLTMQFFVARHVAKRGCCMCNLVYNLSHNDIALQVAENIASCNSAFRGEKNTVCKLRRGIFLQEVLADVQLDVSCQYNII